MALNNVYDYGHSGGGGGVGGGGGSGDDGGICDHENGIGEGAGTGATRALPALARSKDRKGPRLLLNTHI